MQHAFPCCLLVPSISPPLSCSGSLCFSFKLFSVFQITTMVPVGYECVLRVFSCPMWPHHTHYPANIILSVFHSCAILISRIWAFSQSINIKILNYLHRLNSLTCIYCCPMDSVHNRPLGHLVNGKKVQF